MTFLLSPGVLVREFDFTNIIPAVATTPGAYVGTFRWGPVDDVLLINDENGLVKQYDKPDDDTFVDWFTAANFLAYGSNIQICRVVGTGATNAIAGTGAAVLIKNQNDYDDNYADGEGDVGPWAAKYAGEMGNSLAVVVVDQMKDLATYNAVTYDGTNLFSQIFVRPTTSPYVTDRTGLTNAQDEMHILVIDSGGLWTGVKGTILERFGFVSKASDAKASDGTSNYYKNVINTQSAYIWWMDDLSTDTGVGSVTITNAGQQYATAPTLSFVGGSGTGAAGTVVLGTSGFVVNSNLTTGGSGYTAANVAFVGGGGTGAVATATIVGGAVSAINITNVGSGYTSTPTITLTPGGTGGSGAAATAVRGFAITSVVVTDPGTGYVTAPTATLTSAPMGSTGAVAALTSVLDNPQLSGASLGLGSQIMNLSSGAFFKTIQPSSSTLANTSILSGGDAANDVVTDGNRELGWDIFQNADTYDISLVPTGAAGSVLQQYIIDNIAEQRKDCVAFVSPQLTSVKNNLGNQSTDVVTDRNALSSSSYSVMDSGWKYMYDKYNDTFRWVPLNGDIAGLCARSDFTTDPWFSPAGFNRGILLNVVKLAWSPNQAERDALYMNGVNPVVTFPGDGTMLYGDKTMQAKPSAFDRINVRRLFIVIEKAIAIAAKYELFEFNDEFTRALFTNMVEPYLRDVQGRRGITDFDVVCDASNNTGDVIDANEFVADIMVKPARSINFIYLNFVAVGTSVAFSEITSPGV